jgi:dihydroceramidase
MLPLFVDFRLALTSLTQDYYATVYSAEIVNTLTNLLFMWLGIKGIISCRRNGHDQIFLVALLGYLVVGTGSFLFHSTLKCKSSLHAILVARTS